jgi:hypothetical protein
MVEAGQHTAVKRVLDYIESKLDIGELVSSSGMQMQATELDALSASRKRFTIEARAELRISAMGTEAQARLRKRS